MRAVRQVVSILLLPGTVTLLVPWLILSSRPERFATGLGGRLFEVAAAVSGIGLLAAGLTLVVTTVRLFATRGRGTLAPWDPPAELVVVGVYRRVRNPMISGVVSILYGQALLFGSRNLLLWAAAFTLANLVHIPLIEEPQLQRRFGERYRLYQQHVPRWIPRRTPWTPPWGE